MLWLGFDYETTGLDPEKDKIIEAGLVLWDFILQRPLRLFNDLVWEPGYPELSEEITTITGITNEMLQAHGRPPLEVFSRQAELMKLARAGVAYNGKSFDFLFYQKICALLGLDPWPNGVVKIDAMADVPYPDVMSNRKLKYMAADHGFLNPFPHRAQFDALTMFLVMKHYDPEQIMALAEEPSVLMIAILDFQDNHKAKSRGYRFYKEDKKWIKRMKYSQAEKEEQECGFLVERVPDDGRRL